MGVSQAARAVERPLVLVFDDVHWGEETFLDLVEHVVCSRPARRSCCSASPGRSCSTAARSWPVTLRLEPLADEEVDDLIGEQLPGALRERIARAPGGNPLFIEEMLAMAGDARATSMVPPTLQALARRPPRPARRAERGVLERGAVEGEIFHRGAVQALAPDERQRHAAPRGARSQGADPARPHAARRARTASASATC